MCIISLQIEKRRESLSVAGSRGGQRPKLAFGLGNILRGHLRANHRMDTTEVAKASKKLQKYDPSGKAKLMSEHLSSHS